MTAARVSGPKTPSTASPDPITSFSLSWIHLTSSVDSNSNSCSHGTSWTCPTIGEPTDPGTANGDTACAWLVRAEVCGAGADPEGPDVRRAGRTRVSRIRIHPGYDALNTMSVRLFSSRMPRVIA